MVMYMQMCMYLTENMYMYICRGSGPAEDAPDNVALHNFGGNMVVLALCRDVHLRLWATEVSLVYNIM